ncbi:MAG: alpha/beta hydrolase [Xanthobacteraceae bacterium]
MVLLKDQLQHNLLHVSAALFLVGCAGWCWLIWNHFASPVLVEPATAAYTVAAKTDSEVGKSGSFGMSSYERIDHPPAPLTDNYLSSNESPAHIVAREWKLFTLPKVADRGSMPARHATKAANLKPAVHLASLEGAPQSIPAFHAPTEAVPSHVRPPIGEQTALVDFETAPFPYHGMMGDSGRPFLNAGEESHRGHVSFRGHVFWESETFSDDRVLLHIPPGFDPTLPAVMVVFFHGHGANLARDVRDRQQVPAQISAAGVNAVLVAPQFAVDAADSSAGKFWEPNGFKHFLDEAAVKLARLYGDPRRAAAFAKMPIVIVAYSGGFGPTLAVLERGGVRSRVHGVVLLDALYAGIDKFADWIADNRSAFFVSSYTPHTARHNVDLEQLLSEDSVPFSSELRRNHLQGMVAFLPTGDISHRDFVNRAWADYPIADILARMDNSKVETASDAPPRLTSTLASYRN